MISKEEELQRSKNRALMFLGVAATAFLITVVSPENLGVAFVKAVSEAAMVGALADWFAVEALFRQLPIPFVSSHTNIIPKNQEKVADNLADFVRDKFLDEESVARLIRNHDPAKHISDWLVQAENTERLGTHLVEMAARGLDFVEDKPVQNMLAQAFRASLKHVDVSKTAGSILEILTKNRRHQELLNEAIGQFAEILRNPDTQDTIAKKIVRWIEIEHSIIEKFIPTQWVGRKGADAFVTVVSNVLNDISENQEHPLRIGFDAYVEELVHKLKNDPAFIAKGEEIKQYIQNDAALHDYMAGIWSTIRDWLKADLASPQSMIREKIVRAGQWIGAVMANDPALRESINRYIEESARRMAPDFAGFLTKHIRDTIKGWPSEEMSRQIELNIGKDLQFIRINGTIVGGFIGMVLFVISQIPSLVAR